MCLENTDPSFLSNADRPLIMSAQQARNLVYENQKVSQRLSNLNNAISHNASRGLNYVISVFSDKELATTCIERLKHLGYTITIESGDQDKECMIRVQW